MQSIAKPPTDTRALRAWILYELNRRGLSYAEIGRRLGVTRQAVMRVFVQSYPRVEGAIASAIERTPEEIWPARCERRRRRAG